MVDVVNVVGARPQFVKAGPVSKALKESDLTELLVHTGQHYDRLLSEEVMRDAGLRNPDINLGVGSASHAVQTASILRGLEDVLIEHPTKTLLTYGDTNSTIAATLAATKLGIPTIHVEAGLRSFNRAMPEEINRVATDHLSDLLCAPTETAMQYLRNEGLAEKAVLTGDVMVDALRSIDLDSVRLPDWAKGRYYVATIHRAENTDDPGRLVAITDALARLESPVHLLAHPRLADRLDSEVLDEHAALQIRQPLPYAEMLAVLARSSGLVTDSGGLQKEAYLLEVPCVTVRQETEWPETLEGRWNVLVDPGEDLVPILERNIPGTVDAPFGDGNAAHRIVKALQSWI